MHKFDKLLLFSTNLNACVSIYMYKYMKVETNPPLSETENKPPAGFSSSNFSWGSKILLKVCWNYQGGSSEDF